MTTSRREEWLDFWERRELPVLTGLPYVLLTLCTAVDLFAGGGGPVDLAIAVAAAALMASIDLRDHRSSWTEPQNALSTGGAAVAFLVLTGLSAALVIRQPLFGFYVFTGYFWSWRLLEGRARLAGVVLVAGTVAISQTGAGPYRRRRCDRRARGRVGDQHRRGRHADLVWLGRRGAARSTRA